VRNEELLHIVKEERSTLHTIKERKANLIVHILHRNCFLNRVIKGKILGRGEVTGRGGRRRKHLLDDYNETGGYWKLKEETLHHTRWKTRFRTGYDPGVRQSTEYICLRALFFEVESPLRPTSIPQVLICEDP